MISQRELVQKLRDEIRELTYVYEFLNKQLEPMERDAIRYQKLKAESEKGGYLETRDWNWERSNDAPTLDAAVDVLPDVTK